MAEYIERESLLNEICKNKLMVREPAAKKFIGIIESVTAADVRPERHGHWERVSLDDQDEGRFFCSKCKEEIFNPSDDEDMLPNYCPHCGAKMDGKDGKSDENR